MVITIRTLRKIVRKAKRSRFPWHQEVILAGSKYLKDRPDLSKCIGRSYDEPREGLGYLFRKRMKRSQIILGGVATDVGFGTFCAYWLELQENKKTSLLSFINTSSSQESKRESEKYDFFERAYASLNNGDRLGWVEFDQKEIMKKIDAGAYLEIRPVQIRS